MTTTALRTERARILDGESARIARPPARAERGGEWDWFTALSSADQAYIRRHRMASAADMAAGRIPMGPDELAGAGGFETVDDWAAEWLAAVNLGRRNDPMATGGPNVRLADRHSRP